jgi:UDP-3-O-[3-hydroxymyristoyl] glucosamine N-acyltransferase
MRDIMKKSSESKHREFTVAEIARYLNCPFQGEGSTVIRDAASLEDAEKGTIVFCTQKKYWHLLENTKASAAIIHPDHEFSRIPVLRSENPQLSFIRVTGLFFKPYRPEPGIHNQAYISPSAKIGKNVSIGAFSIIGDETEIDDGTVIFPLVSVYPRVKMGKKCIIHSHVSLREDVLIGDKVILHNGVVVGSYGFGYLQAQDKSRIKIPQRGTVVIEDDVEIGANTAIDRATLGKTIVRKGTKIDNLVQIAHNVEIGENSILVSQTGIAGSTKIGKNVILSGQVGITDHVTVGDNVVVAAKSGITKSIPPGSMVAGAPHFEIKEWRKVWASIPQLYELIREVRRLKKQIKRLESK